MDFLNNLENKMQHILDEKFDLHREISKQVHDPKLRSSREQLYTPGGEFKASGTKEKVRAKIGPDLAGKFLFHTHPHGLPMPSREDLEASISSAEKGLQGLVIFGNMPEEEEGSLRHYMIIIPTDPDLNRISKYEHLVRDGKFDEALKTLSAMGFNIETGDI